MSARVNELRIPDDYLPRLPTVDRIRQVLDAAPLPSVACHNDLLRRTSSTPVTTSA